jgi:hypothetical protein
MGVRVRVEAIHPEAQVVPVRRERRAEIDAGHRFLHADLQDLVEQQRWTVRVELRTD